ncbi:PHR isoform X6 [Spatholobus suberectus]|nr:PHR isoform X6 [Spatholobus suberectus]
MEASKVDHSRSGSDQVNGSTAIEEGSLEKGGKPGSPKLNMLLLVMIVLKPQSVKEQSKPYESAESHYQQ